jgi:hypothetical protein
VKSRKEKKIVNLGKKFFYKNMMIYIKINLLKNFP